MPWTGNYKQAYRDRNIVPLQSWGVAEGSETLASANDVTVSLLANDGHKDLSAGEGGVGWGGVAVT